MDDPNSVVPRSDPNLILLGQVLGEVKGIREQIAQANSDTHRRIDDLADAMRQQTAALDRRMDDHQKDTESRFEEIGKRIKTAEENATKAVELAIDANRTATNAERVAAEAKLNKTQLATTSGGASAVAITLMEVLKALIK
jgi:methyl-accepting chemotaxis protein